LKKCDVEDVIIFIIGCVNYLPRMSRKHARNAATLNGWIIITA